MFSERATTQPIQGDRLGARALIATDCHPPQSPYYTVAVVYTNFVNRDTTVQRLSQYNLYINIYTSLIKLHDD